MPHMIETRQKEKCVMKNITPRENLIRFFNNESVEWMPSRSDLAPFFPDIIPDNKARGTVSSEEPYTDDMYGGKDWFGVPWIFQPREGGSMEEPGFRLLDDIQDWESHLVFPDLDALDWEGCVKRSQKFLNTDKMINTPIYTGFFERLISFMGFENAAIAMIDEDAIDHVKALFSRLAQFYVDLIKKLHTHFNVESIFFHDDWGTQRSPFFSAEVHKEMIAPYIKHVAEHAHKMGVFIEMHSCGMITPLIPNLIETGIDTWMGQSNINDKYALVEKHGDKFKFCVDVHGRGHLLSDDEIDEISKEFVEKYAQKKVWFGIFPDVDRGDARKLSERIYALLSTYSR